MPPKLKCKEASALAKTKFGLRYERPEDMHRHTTNIREASLTLLKTKALKALFSVPIFDVQKLIRRNEVIPMSSQPRSRPNHDPDSTNRVIDHPNSLKYARKLIIFFSNLI